MVPQKQPETPQSLQTPASSTAQSSMAVTEASTEGSSMFHRLDAKTLSNRMIESVNFAKELMQTTRGLRVEMEEMDERLDRAENENFHLSTENRDLRDRIEILESVIGQSNVGNEFENMDWREIIEENKAPQIRSNNQTMNEIIDQLFYSKKEMAKKNETNSALMSENQQLKQQIEQFKAQQQR